ncbi:MAG TPA: hypothetical protein VKU38_11060 [Ktedonobacteraceae bacterium]|nr:hypothetical protein [Ktedonobacteraceae bacterium]
MIASDTLARLLKQVQDEIQQEDFCGLCLLLIVDGYKAREAMTLASMRPVMRLSAQEYIL